jgi:hypothetical protein
MINDMNKVFRWSFSQWESYQQCPAKWKYQSVLRLPRTPPGPAAARGLDLHDRVENYIKGALPLDNLLSDNRDHNELGFEPATVARKYIPIFEEFRTHPNGARHTEYKLGFDEEWLLTSPTSPRASCIMVLDAVRSGGAWSGPERGLDDGIVRIAEWKSGKPKDTHADQRKMYAIGGLKAWLADRVEVTTYYLEDTAPPQKFVASASAWPKLTALWSERRDLMMRDEMCAPRPGYYCRWCDYASSKGGPCKFA